MNNDTQLIEKRIDKSITSEIAVGARGGVSYSNAGQVMELAKMMAVAEVAVPAHLRGNPGACLAVAFQALDWGMSPFAVANKSYSVNNRMAYEAQMINAVILNRAPIKGRLKYEYTGAGPTRQCTVSATLDDGDTVEYTSPMVKDIKTKNSPLWTGDPDQQLAYFSSRSMCRRHFPDVILGVYTPDEMAEADPRDVTPPKQTAQERLQARLAQNAQQEAQSSPEATETANASPSADEPPFTDAEVLPPEEQSQEQPEPEIDHVFADFLLSIDEMTEGGEFNQAREQAMELDSEEKIQAAKDKIKKRAESCGYTWSSKAKSFITG